MSTFKLFEASQVRSLWDQEKVTALPAAHSLNVNDDSATMTFEFPVAFAQAKNSEI